MQMRRPLLQGRRSQLFRFLPAVFLLLGLYLPQQIWSQATSSTPPLSPSDWTLAYSGQDATLTSVTYGGQTALQWQVTSALGHSDWVYDTLPLPTDETYTFTVELAGTGTAALNIWNGEENVTSPPIQLSTTFQTVSETVSVLSPNPQFQILDPDGATSTVNVYFTNPAVTLVGPASGLSLYQIAYGGQDSTLTSTNYDGATAFEWQVSSALGHSDWVYTYPPFVAGVTYQVSEQVAGRGTAEINVWDGNENVSGLPVPLTPNVQTITATRRLQFPSSDLGERLSVTGEKLVGSLLVRVCDISESMDTHAQGLGRVSCLPPSALPGAARAPRSSLSPLVTVFLSLYLSKALRLPSASLWKRFLPEVFSTNSRPGSSATKPTTRTRSIKRSKASTPSS
jgi:hypothetical protein